MPKSFFKRAKPTTLFGITYRSRLEAQWALFFHLAKINFVYEPHRIFLPEIQDVYIPDFVVETSDGLVYLEIKHWNWEPSKAYLSKLFLFYLSIPDPTMRFLVLRGTPHVHMAYYFSREQKRLCHMGLPPFPGLLAVQEDCTESLLKESCDGNC